MSLLKNIAIWCAICIAGICMVLISSVVESNFFIETTFATSSPDPSTVNVNGSKEESNVANYIATTINSLVWVALAMITPIVVFASWLMTPDWTSGDLFNLRAPMHGLWKVVANIVYIVYGILLIVIAIGTMFNSQNYSYKTMFGKLLLGILLVPFTWFFVQWMISIAAYVTAQVITIPTNTITTLLHAKSGPSGQPNWWWQQPVIPTEINIQDSEYKFGNSTDSRDVYCTNNPWKCVSPEKILSRSSGIYGHLLVYTYGIFKVHESKLIPTGGVDTVKNYSDLISWMLISSILFLVFCFLMVALTAILFVRAIKLWIYAIFSPIFTLNIAAGDLFKMGDQDNTFDIKEFIGLTFVPAVVWLALAFWLIVLAAVQNFNGPNTQTCTSEQLKTAWCKLVQIMGNPANSITRKLEPAEPANTFTNLMSVKIGEITMNFRGKAGGITDTEQAASDTANAKNVIDASGGIFGTMIINFIALVFIWIAFMAAKSISKVVNRVVSPFEDFGSAIAKKLPNMVPLPTSMGGSIGGLKMGMDQLKSIPDIKAQADYQRSGLYKIYKEMTGQGNAVMNVNQAMTQMKASNYKQPTDYQNLAQQIQSGQAMGEINNIHKTQANQWRDFVKNFDASVAQQAGIDINIASAIAEMKSNADSLDEKDIARVIAMLGDRTNPEKYRTAGTWNIAIAWISNQKAANNTSAQTETTTGTATTNHQATINVKNSQPITITVRQADGAMKDSTEIARDITGNTSAAKKMTEDGWKSALAQSDSSMTDEIRTKIIDEIKAIDPDFFTK